jgi:hypothetical protein
MGFAVSRRAVPRLAALAALAAALGGCAGLPGPAPRWTWFEPAPEEGAWSGPIARWQARAQDAAAPAPAAVSAAPPAAAAGEARPGRLAVAFQRFEVERRRSLASAVAEFVQERARRHFIADGPFDRWATLEEVFAADGDDCDGLALLALALLRDFGFDEAQLFQGIVRRDEDGLHHMVTLWFEDPVDPWVLDPTGALESGLARWSDVEGWQPLAVFTERESFAVAPEVAVPGVSARPPSPEQP